MKNTILLTALLSASVVSAQTVNNWVNSTNQPWKNGYNQCWRNSSWTPATAHPDCDGALKPEPQRVQVTIPAPVRQEAPAPAPKKAEIIKLSYSTDTLFDFDKSIIKLEGRQMLDGLIGMINKDYNLEVIIAVGHTDSIGTEAYNLKLGMRRAEAVKAYMIARGIEKNRVYTESKGESQPIASNKTAQGRAQNRRVDIEVVGTSK